MNRKERRNYEKRYGTTPLLEKIKQEGIKEGRAQALDLILTMVAYTIDYKLELDKDKLCTLMDSIMLNIDAYRTDHLSAQDFVTIKQELAEKGIIIKENK